MSTNFEDMIGRGLDSAKPTAGKPGRLYFSTDVGDSGTLYRDNGSSWDENGGGGGSGAAVGLYGSRNLRVSPDSPSTSITCSADFVQLVNPSDNTIAVRGATGNITCDITAAGPAINSRDQSGSFSNNSWIYFYFIWNGTTLATISSTLTPADGGPVFPTGYTHYCFITALRRKTTDYLGETLTKGNKVYLIDAGQDTGHPLAGAGATEDTLVDVDVSDIVPPNAMSFSLFVDLQVFSYTGVGDEILAYFFHVPHVNDTESAGYMESTTQIDTGDSIYTSQEFEFSNEEQKFAWAIYTYVATTSNHIFDDSFIQWYTVPNGAI